LQKLTDTDLFHDKQSTKTIFTPQLVKKLSKRMFVFLTGSGEKISTPKKQSLKCKTRKNEFFFCKTFSQEIIKALQK